MSVMALQAEVSLMVADATSLRIILAPSKGAMARGVLVTAAHAVTPDKQAPSRTPSPDAGLEVGAACSGHAKGNAPRPFREIQYDGFGWYAGKWSHLCLGRPVIPDGAADFLDKFVGLGQIAGHLCALL